MAICSYLVIPVDGAGPGLAERLAGLSACEVTRQPQHELLLLVTETSGPAEEAALRATLDGMTEIRALVPTFAELDP